MSRACSIHKHRSLRAARNLRDVYARARSCAGWLRRRARQKNKAPHQAYFKGRPAETGAKTGSRRSPLRTTLNHRGDVPPLWFGAFTRLSPVVGDRGSTNETCLPKSNYRLIAACVTRCKIDTPCEALSPSETTGIAQPAGLRSTWRPRLRPRPPVASSGSRSRSCCRTPE